MVFLSLSVLYFLFKIRPTETTCNYTAITSITSSCSLRPHPLAQVHQNVAHVYAFDSILIVSCFA